MAEKDMQKNEILIFYICTFKLVSNINNITKSLKQAFFQQKYLSYSDSVEYVFPHLLTIFTVSMHCKYHDRIYSY